MLHIDPLLRAAHDVYARVEAAAVLDGVYLLHAEGLAVAHYGAGILRMKHILGEDAHVVGALCHGAAQYLLSLVREKLGHIVEALAKPSVAMLLGA